MSPKQEHHVFIYTCRSAIPGLGPYSRGAIGFELQLWPWSSWKIKPVKVVAIVTIITSEDIQGILVNYCGVTVPRGGRGTTCTGRDHLLPGVGIKVIFIEIIHSVEAIITSKNENWPVVHDYRYYIEEITRNMTIPWWGGHVIIHDLGPGIRLYIVLIEIIFPIHSVIATKNVDVVLKSYTSVQGSLYCVSIEIIPDKEQVHVIAAHTNTKTPRIFLYNL